MGSWDVEISMELEAVTMEAECCFVSPWCVSPFHFQPLAASFAFHVATCEPKWADCFFRTRCCRAAPRVLDSFFVVYLINCHLVIVNKHTEWDIISLLSALRFGKKKNKSILFMACFRMSEIVIQRKSWKTIFQFQCIMFIFLCDNTLLFILTSKDFL